MEEICLVHHDKWRGRFQHMLNKLRTEILPKTCVRQFQTLVCSCERKQLKGKTQFQIPMDFDFSTISILPEPVENILQDLSQKHLWSSQCNHGNNGCNCARSVQIMLYLISLVVAGDFNVFGQVGGKKKVQSKYTLTKRIVVDNLVPEHVGRMVGSNGQNIKKITRKYKCVVRFENQDDKHVVACVQIKRNKQDVVTELMSSLSLEASKIAKERLLCDKRVQKYAERKSREAKCRHKVRVVDDDGWTLVN